MREVRYCNSGANSDESRDFIGYRASAGTIRKRLELSGYSFSALQLDFEESLERYIDELENVRRIYQDDLSKNGNNLLNRNMALETLDVQTRMILCIRGTSVEDWIKLLPAARNERIKYKLGQPLQYFGTEWVDCGDNPSLLSAMLSKPLTFKDGYFTADFNFPVSNPDFFALALLTTVTDDAVCELDLTELINSEYLDDFTDLAELTLSETSHCQACRESLTELEILAAVESANATLQRMCYASMITAMEAYLGDIIKREIMKRPSLKERFVASYEEYNSRSVGFLQRYNE